MIRVASVITITLYPVIQLMTSSLALPLHSTITQAANCCQQHLKPLIERIDQLEAKLKLETDRRENEYNQLLKMCITVRKEPNRYIDNQGSQLQVAGKNNRAARKMTSPGIKPILKVSSQRKMTLKTQQQYSTPNDKKAQLLFHNENVRKQLPGKAITPSELEMVGRLAVVEDGLAKQQSELAKIKELNDYLMQQLLGLFEKTKELEDLSVAVKKNIQSEETVTSLVMENDNHQDHIKIINKQFNSSRTEKSDLSKVDLGELASRISQHEGMLSDLIQLTKHLSSQFQLMPTEWGTRSTH